MAHTNETSGYNFPQWEPSDKPDRVDFNAAFGAIDTALGNKVNKNGDTVTGSLNITNNLQTSSFAINNGDFYSIVYFRKSNKDRAAIIHLTKEKQAI